MMFNYPIYSRAGIRLFCHFPHFGTYAHFVDLYINPKLLAPLALPGFCVRWLLFHSCKLRYMAQFKVKPTSFNDALIVIQIKSRFWGIRARLYLVEGVILPEFFMF